jgi:hypothetical protein
MRRCPVEAWEGWEGWTTKRDLHEDFERAAAGKEQPTRPRSCGVQVPKAPVWLAQSSR